DLGGPLQHRELQRLLRAERSDDPRLAQAELVGERADGQPLEALDRRAGHAVVDDRGAGHGRLGGAVARTHGAQSTVSYLTNGRMVRCGHALQMAGLGGFELEHDGATLVIDPLGDPGALYAVLGDAAAGVTL